MNVLYTRLQLVDACLTSTKFQGQKCTLYFAYARLLELCTTNHCISKVPISVHITGSATHEQMKETNEHTEPGCCRGAPPEYLIICHTVTEIFSSAAKTHATKLQNSKMFKNGALAHVHAH